jgi:selenide,water dikinase
VAERTLRELERRGIVWRGGARVDAVEKGAIVVDGDREPCDLAVWATGAAPQPLGAASGLPLDERGFIRVRSTLEVEECEGLFAVGDCAALVAYPWVPRAGVYAVRQGPVLDANLRARSDGRPLRAYRPQRDFLALLNMGGGRALGIKWGHAFTGRWVWELKDRIDRRFMRRFQVLGEDSGIKKGFPSSSSMSGEPMECGGCAAKLEAPRLDAALARLDPAPADPSVVLGLSQADDAAAWSHGGQLALATLDGFRAFTDDPWLVGRVAAVNAVSDVYAVGGRPTHAMAWVSIPERAGGRAEEMLYQVLAGVRAALDPLSVSLVGGHTNRGPELQVGLSVYGELPGGERPLALDGLAPGDALILTKPLGTGVLLAADMLGRLPGRWLAPLHASLARPNAHAAGIARAFGVRGATDVSGFGLARHLDEMLRASDAAARLFLSALPELPGAVAMLGQGLRSTFHGQNVLGPGEIEADDPVRARPTFDLIFDPQTSGGLLFGVAPGRATEVLAALREGGDASAAVVGAVQPSTSPGPRVRVTTD